MRGYRTFAGEAPALPRDRRPGVWREAADYVMGGGGGGGGGSLITDYVLLLQTLYNTQSGKFSSKSHRQTHVL